MEQEIKRLVNEKQVWIRAFNEGDRSLKLKKVRNKERVDFTIDSCILRKFRQCSKKIGIPMSKIIEDEIKKYVENKK